MAIRIQIINIHMIEIGLIVHWNKNLLANSRPAESTHLWVRLANDESSCAISQAISHWHLSAEAQIRTHVSPYGIYSGQSGTGTGFCLSSSVFPCQYHSTAAPYSLMDKESVRGSVPQKHCLTPSQQQR
jgi:hypothetical protein